MVSKSSKEHEGIALIHSLRFEDYGASHTIHPLFSLNAYRFSVCAIGDYHCLWGKRHGLVDCHFRDLEAGRLRGSKLGYERLSGD
jgi:hypothetical protein